MNDRTYERVASVGAIVTATSMAVYYKTGSANLVLDVLMYGLVVILLVATIARMRRPS